MDDFDDINFRLQRLQIARQELPQVVLLASGNRCFRLSEDNQKMASLDEFLKPLQALNEATQHLGGDFIVALLAPAMLHVSTIDRLSSSILNLLEKRMSVHVRLTPLKEHGLPQDRKILTMIASPYCTELPWNADNIELAAGNTRSTVEDAIGDLGFPNPRVPSHTRSGFVCRSPSQMGDNRVYNHYTGQVLEAGQEPIVVEADTILDGFDECKPWIHSGSWILGLGVWILDFPLTIAASYKVRRDRLTVRELARIQGFPDNFIFYGSMADQYDDIWRAVPPTVTKTVAQLVWQLIEGRGPVKTERLNRRSHPRSHHCPPSSSTPLSTSASTSTRGYKRPRVDSADED
ncbi:hypothetical protein A1O3_04127 [Capronia epimyces CBS 606.96]|uniref:DNA (Cytosine-5-)-methyltransferase n=1 Tax=Capronia epimyces CBS 606.96 TaxID=1182542 RepID=W9Y3S9_9EURO|nr:uncharacterized protein A1O3_04127 [Capronia epimyces CBS 606.96]EXJ87168.1 hypothetical protein A1O3_04127 [Capronia epimyces CBS 606.96]